MPSVTRILIVDDDVIIRDAYRQSFATVSTRALMNKGSILFGTELENRYTVDNRIYEVVANKDMMALNKTMHTQLERQTMLLDEFRS